MIQYCCSKTFNWLQVLRPAECSQIDQRVRHQLHPIVPLLDTFKSEQESLELIFPRESPFDTHPQRMDSFIEEPLPSTFRGFAVARILLDVGDQTGIEDALAIAGGIKTTIQVEVGAAEVQPDLCGHPLQRFQPLW